MVSPLRIARHAIPVGATLLGSVLQPEVARYFATIIPAALTIALIAAASPEIGLAIIESQTEKHNDWWSAFVSDDAKTTSEVRRELREKAKDRKAVDAIIYAANNLRNMISRESAQALGYLTRDYARGETKKPDRFFRGVCAVLCEAESADVLALRGLFASTVRSAFDSEDPIMFWVRKSDITVMKTFAAMPPNPTIQATDSITAMDDPRRIAHILTTHSIARVLSNPAQWGGKTAWDGFSVPRSDCLRLASILSGVK